MFNQAYLSKVNSNFVIGLYSNLLARDNYQLKNIHMIIRQIKKIKIIIFFKQEHHHIQVFIFKPIFPKELVKICKLITNYCLPLLLHTTDRGYIYIIIMRFVGNLLDTVVMFYISLAVLGFAVRTRDSL